MSVPSAGSSAAASAAVSAHSGALRALRQQLSKSQLSSVTQQIIPTEIPALNAVLPQGGFPTASVLEWVSEYPGLSAAGIAMRCVRSFLELPGCLAIVDSRREFHAAAAEVAGISLARLLLIRPEHQKDALWALEQAARCSGVRVVMCWLDRVSATALRRLQLAVERSGVTVFLIRPASVLKQPSWADYRLLVGAAESDGLQEQKPAASVKGSPVLSRVLSVQILRTRHSVRNHGRALLKFDDETGALLTISELAHTATAASAVD